MANVVGNQIKHIWISRSLFDGLDSKSADAIYFVGEADNTISLYKGGRNINNGYVTVASLTGLSGVADKIYFNQTDSMFYMYNGSAFVPIFSEVVVDDTIALPNDNRLATTKVITKAIADAIAQSTAGRLLAPVQNTTALAAYGTAQDALVDKTMCLVEDNGNLYRFDAQSTDAADGFNVVRPGYIASDAAGRWIRMTTNLQFNTTEFTLTDNGVALNEVPLSKIDGIEDVYVQHYAVMPTVTSANNGEVAVFTGTSNDTYKKGYAYKVVNGAWEVVTQESTNFAPTDDVPGTEIGVSTVAAVGTSSDGARADHTHALDSALVASIGQIGSNAAAISSLSLDLASVGSVAAKNGLDIIDLFSITSLTNVAVASNTAEIAKNASAIASNTTQIGINAAAIASNTALISSNASAISSNTAQIASNAAAISSVVDALDDISSDTDDKIASNTAAIASNSALIGSNAAAIASNTTAIGSNAAAIASNTAKIGANTSAIASNTALIGSNASAIASNTNAITSNTNSIASIGSVIEGLYWINVTA